MRLGGEVVEGDVVRGRVEVCINDAWGTVCGNQFGTNDAIVVCYQLGFQRQGMSV